MTGFARDQAETQAATLIAGAIARDTTAITRIYEALVHAGRHETIGPETYSREG